LNTDRAVKKIERKFEGLKPEEVKKELKRERETPSEETLDVYNTFMEACQNISKK